MARVRPLRTRQQGVKKVPREVREREILQVATQVFSRRGYHQASMDEVAEGAGISKPMIYAYFGSKEGLYLASIRAAGRALMANIAEAPDDSLPPDEQLWRGTLAFFTFVDKNRDGWAVLYREATAKGGPSAAEVAGMRRDIVGLVSQLLAEAASAEQVEPMLLHEMEPLAQALVGAGESLANWWSEHPDQDAERLAARLMNLTWMGLGDLLEGRQWARSEPNSLPSAGASPG